MITPHLGYVSEQKYRKYFPDLFDDIWSWRDGKPVWVIEGKGRRRRHGRACPGHLDKVGPRLARLSGMRGSSPRMTAYERPSSFAALL